VYTVSTPVRTAALKDKMLGFLETHYRPWNAIVEVTGHRFEGPLGANGRCTIGFQYQPPVSGAEREYNYAVLRWIAIQVGRRRSTFREGKFVRPVPYCVYDREIWPILVNEEWTKVPKSLSWCVHDKLGVGVDAGVANELAWYHIPREAFLVVSAANMKQHWPSDMISETLIQSGLDGAQKVLAVIRAEIARLDLFWQTRV
jgi:hypothetical protein